MENFTPLELFNKIYTYLRKSLFWRYNIIENEKRFNILYYNHLIMSFYFANNNLYYSTDSNRSGEIKTIEDVDDALNKCCYYFCDKKFSLFFKCNLI